VQYHKKKLKKLPLPFFILFSPLREIEIEGAQEILRELEGAQVMREQQVR
jgi:hypothetical protein